MIRKICKIFSVVAILFATSNAYSQDGLAVGISGSLIDIEASGKHTMRTSGKTDSTGAADNQTGIGSVFAEYTWNNITLGLDYIPGSADISNSIKQRDEVESHCVADFLIPIISDTVINYMIYLVALGRLEGLLLTRVRIKARPGLTGILHILLLAV